ncbi:MAG: DUF3833 family protein [Acidocella sp.]|nr:DUF3833 family protein [Acidocella sp.]
MRWLNLTLPALAFCSLSACASMQPQDFSGGSPTMALNDYFPGHSTAYGIFIDRFGNVRNQFTVDCHGSWDGTTMILQEHFTYVGGANGQPTSRTWHFHKTGPNSWEGTAGDVIGVATGKQDGNAFHMTYVTELHTGSSTHQVSVSDWMFRESPGVVINHTTISKLGITLGDVQIAFVHQ